MDLEVKNVFLFKWFILHYIMLIEICQIDSLTGTLVSMHFLLCTFTVCFDYTQILAYYLPLPCYDFSSSLKYHYILPHKTLLSLSKI